jgi:hypothetical protein
MEAHRALRDKILAASLSGSFPNEFGRIDGVVAEPLHIDHSRDKGADQT